MQVGDGQQKNGFRIHCYIRRSGARVGYVIPWARNGGWGQFLWLNCWWCSGHCQTHGGVQHLVAPEYIVYNIVGLGYSGGTVDDLLGAWGQGLLNMNAQETMVWNPLVAR